MPWLTIRVEIPALQSLVDYLEEREQINALETQVISLAERLKTSSDTLQQSEKGAS